MDPVGTVRNNSAENAPVTEDQKAAFQRTHERIQREADANRRRIEMAKADLDNLLIRTWKDPTCIDWLERIALHSCGYWSDNNGVQILVGRHAGKSLVRYGPTTSLTRERGEALLREWMPEVAEDLAACGGKFVDPPKFEPVPRTAEEEAYFADVYAKLAE